MSNNSVLQRHDEWLDSDGPVAVILRESLQPVEGEDGVVFPPTFAPPAKGEPPYYVIDQLSDKSKTSILDTVGSQANRLEPLFKQLPYSALVPSAAIRINGRSMDLLEAGHRAADAVVRFSSKRNDIAEAFSDIAKRGDATKLAKLAPTSLVFGVWDSRATQVKLPRLIGSTIRAHKVEELTRAAQFFSALEKQETESLGQTQDFLSEQGLSDAPAGRGLGGLIARGGIRRETVLNLVALRALSADTEEQTKNLQRYLLGLALVALTATADLNLRQGCLLVGIEGQPRTQQVVMRNGKREALDGLNAGAALEYACAVRDAFGIGENWEATFESNTVLEEATKAAKTKAGKTKSDAKGKKAEIVA
jgi:CRISPR-associated protein Csb1